ncbi:FkbM family methyltransferase [Pectinatus brassicae]|uniref:FkbM family methyltransferase n=1 Tax=Pectinatus brassicae TaxID=862415 RepID=A0A840UQ64_9FIRM|nr:FkbM family methyltransferase [Pectinatus brassicae]MBB5336848.1 FkbM family methyltransferase [Pectinatus brassicae]
MFNEQDFLINIVDNYHKKNSIIEQIKMDKNKLILWGCGDLAKVVLKYLRKNKINLTACVVDFSVEENEIFDNIPVLSRRKLREKNEYYSVIIGHSHYDKEKEIIQEKNIEKVYAITSICYDQEKIIPYDFIIKHKDEFQKNFELFDDKKSKENMCAYFNARINDDFKYILDCDISEKTYFNNDVFKLSECESFIDIGAYNGDTIKMFLNAVNNKYEYILALEPEKNNYKELEKYISKEKIKNIDTLNIGTWNKNKKLYFNIDETSGSSIVKKESKQVIVVKMLDNICKSKKVTLIKINFLSGVLETIEGAAEILKTQTPKLAIVVGFDEWSLLKIPLKIKEIQPNYKVYLRYNSAMPARLVLYAVKKEEKVN